MKKTLALLLMTAAFAMAATKGNPNASVDGANTFAPVYDSSTYNQYDHDELPNGGDYIDNPGAPSAAATAKIKLHVAGGTKVWLTNWVSNWEEIPDLNTPFDMEVTAAEPQKYGYFTTEGGAVTWSDGTTTDITYSDSAAQESITTTGYLLDQFEDDADIYLVLTPRDNEGETLGFTVDTAETVSSTGNVTSRFDGTGYETDYDLAGNVKINFTLKGYGDRTFVAVFEKPITAGQPLPGTLVAGLLSVGSILAGKRMKKRS